MKGEHIMTNGSNEMVMPVAPMYGNAGGFGGGCFGGDWAWIILVAILTIMPMLMVLITLTLVGAETAMEMEDIARRVLIAEVGTLWVAIQVVIVHTMVTVGIAKTK